MKRLLIIILTLVFLTSNSSVCMANLRDFPFDRENTDSKMLGMMYGLALSDNGTIVSVGDRGSILTKKDTWTEAKKITDQSLYKAYWFKDKFFALGKSGIVLQSEDGSEWEKVIIDSTSDFYGMSKGSNGFVIVGNKGYVFFSEDLKKWEKYELPEKDAILKSVYWDGDSYIGVGCIGEKTNKKGIVFVSNDGAKWDKLFTTEETADFVDITVSDDLFVIVNSYGSVWKSIDKTNWEKQVLIELSSSYMPQQLNSVYWSGMSYVLCGERAVFISNDEINWSKIPYDMSFHSTIWDGARYIFSTDGVFFTYSPDDVLKIIYNNKPIAFKDVTPRIICDRTMIPVRGLFERMGATVVWDDSKNEITIKSKDTTIILTLDSQDTWVNGVRMTMDVPATIINNRTLIPLRFVSENINKKVDWEAATNTVRITDIQ